MIISIEKEHYKA